MSSFLEGSKGSCLLGIFFQILSALFLSLLFLSFIHAVIPNWFSSDSETLIILNLVKDEWPWVANISNPSVPYAKWSYCTFTLRKIFPKNSHWYEEIKSNLIISPDGQFPKSSVEIPGISHLELYITFMTREKKAQQCRKMLKTHWKTRIKSIKNMLPDL